MSLKSLNEVNIVGVLGRDPEMRYAANGNAIANLSIATSEGWVDKATGQRQERTEWHRVVIFGKTAEVAGQYLAKGSQVFIKGRLQTRKWQDQNTGQDHYSTEVVVDFDGKMIMLGGGNRNNNDGGNNHGNNGGYNGQGNAQAVAPQQAQAPAQQTVQQPVPAQAPVAQTPATQQAREQQAQQPAVQQPATQPTATEPAMQDYYKGDVPGFE